MLAQGHLLHHVPLCHPAAQGTGHHSSILGGISFLGFHATPCFHPVTLAAPTRYFLILPSFLFYFLVLESPGPCLWSALLLFFVLGFSMPQGFTYHLQDMSLTFISAVYSCTLSYRREYKLVSQDYHGAIPQVPHTDHVQSETLTLLCNLFLSYASLLLIQWQPPPPSYSCPKLWSHLCLPCLFFIFVKKKYR